jgi:hypothetical protein
MALGKRPKYTRQSQHSKFLVRKGVFVECYFLVLGKAFAECRHSVKIKTKKSKKNGKSYFLKEASARQPLPTGQVQEFFCVFAVVTSLSRVSTLHHCTTL